MLCRDRHDPNIFENSNLSNHQENLISLPSSAELVYDQVYKDQFQLAPIHTKVNLSILYAVFIDNS